jgi:hypothetical protein
MGSAGGGASIDWVKGNGVEKAGGRAVGDDAGHTELKDWEVVP